MKDHANKGRRGEETRERVLEAALETFSHDGYDGTTVRTICEAAGVSVGVINYHWGSKEQLWQAVCEMCRQRVLEIFSSAPSIDLSTDSGLRDFLGRVFDALADEPKVIRIFMWATLEAEAIDYPTTRQRFQPLIEFGTACLQQWQAEGRVHHIDVELALMTVRAVFVFTLVDRSGHRQAFGKDLSDAEHAQRMKAHLVQAAMAILGAADTPPGGA